MKPDEIPDDLSPDEQLRAINLSLVQLHACMDGRMDGVEKVLGELIAAKAAERARTLKDVQEERHRAKNEETKLNGLVAHVSKAVDTMSKQTAEQHAAAAIWRDGAHADIKLLKAAVGADKPAPTVAAMSQRKFLVLGGIAATLAVGGPTVMQELMVLFHGLGGIFISIGAIH